MHGSGITEHWFWFQMDDLQKSNYLSQSEPPLKIQQVDIIYKTYNETLDQTQKKETKTH